MKPEFYKDFQCIADRCKFTCCAGWDIMIDSDTYNKWTSHEKQSEYLRKHIKWNKQSKRVDRYIKMSSDRSCPFLQANGLCSVYINYGEDYLPKTCKEFPRQSNQKGEFTEYSLSCSCPSVVDLVCSLENRINFVTDNESSSHDRNSFTMDYKVREQMIKILQSDQFSLSDKILLNFHMLLNMKIGNGLSADILNKYQEEIYLQTLVEVFNDTMIDPEDSILEINEIFLDITLNYRNEKQFRNYLKDIVNTAETMDVEDLHVKRMEFTAIISQYEKLLENCIVLKLFSECTSLDLDELIMSYQLVITEYVMVRHSVFLKWLLKRIDYEDIRDYIVVYSRMIGYNAEGIREFWEESFDEADWEFGYIQLLLNS